METPVAYNGIVYLHRPLMLDADVKPPPYLPDRSAHPPRKATMLPFKRREDLRQHCASAPGS